MRKFIFVANSKISDQNNVAYDKFISFSNKKDDERFAKKGNYYSPAEFAAFIKSLRPANIVFDFDAQDEFDFIIDLICDFIVSLHISSKRNLKFSMLALERCLNLETVRLYWNTKQDSLWDVKKNPKLKSFEITDYYNVSDFDAFRQSSVEKLCLFGCNGLSSFTSKLHVKDFSFIAEMPNLKVLRMDIVKDKASEYYLSLIARCRNLEVFSTTNSFFTFQQFAWLKSKLPNVREGLDCVSRSGNDLYAIIGKRTPKTLDNITKTEKYQQRYDAMIKSYADRIDPPSDSEKE